MAGEDAREVWYRLATEQVAKSLRREARAELKASQLESRLWHARSVLAAIAQDSAVPKSLREMCRAELERR